ncbi:hypothetical protein ColTof4_13560 [Colletotrichum tofieldiae]|nr:hypothetical protein ColTof4_13560 [Colletotrichum tofieldiae]GKT97349.1 hypothetical protein Ct61P_15199 [Colletotrichum tofieldiae]
MPHLTTQTPHVRGGGGARTKAVIPGPGFTADLIQGSQGTDSSSWPTIEPTTEQPNKPNTHQLQNQHRKPLTPRSFLAAASRLGSDTDTNTVTIGTLLLRPTENEAKRAIKLGNTPDTGMGTRNSCGTRGLFLSEADTGATRLAAPGQARQPSPCPPYDPTSSRH